MVPWWIRIGAKLVLARLPMSYAFWKRLRLFEHGTMEQPARALETFVEHARTAGVLGSDWAEQGLVRQTDRFNVLELGPGDSLFTAVIAKSLGASRTWLVDAGAYATTGPGAYGQLLRLLQEHRLAVPADIDAASVAQLLIDCDGVYLTSGVQSLAELATNSIDYCFSNAVLEHVPKEDFATLVRELKRVLRPDGVCVHRVDLKDHLGGGLNNLRFSAATWEGAVFRNSGFYTNRIRFAEMVGMFENGGFRCDLPRKRFWEHLPLPRRKLDAAFRDLPDHDLLVSGFDVVLRHDGAVS